MPFVEPGIAHIRCRFDYNHVAPYGDAVNVAAPVARLLYHQFVGVVKHISETGCYADIVVLHVHAVDFLVHRNIGVKNFGQIHHTSVVVYDIHVGVFVHSQQVFVFLII